MMPYRRIPCKKILGTASDVARPSGQNLRPKGKVTVMIHQGSHRWLAYGEIEYQRGA